MLFPYQPSNVILQSCILYITSHHHHGVMAITSPRDCHNFHQFLLAIRLAKVAVMLQPRYISQICFCYTMGSHNITSSYHTIVYNSLRVFQGKWKVDSTNQKSWFLSLGKTVNLRVPRYAHVVNVYPFYFQLLMHFEHLQALPWRCMCLRSHKLNLHKLQSTETTKYRHGTTNYNNTV